MATVPPKAPNLERLLSYIKKSSWQHVSANFTGFARKEFETSMEKLDEEGTTYPHIQKLVRDAELGRFTNTKEMLDLAEADLYDIQRRLTDLEYAKKTKTPRSHALNSYRPNVREPHDPYSPPPAGRHEGNKPVKSVHYQERPGSDRRNARDTYTPQKHDPQPHQTRETYSPAKRDTYSPDKRDIYSPDKRPMAPSSPGKPPNRDTYSPEKGRVHSGRDDGYGYQKHGRHEVVERGLKSPIKDDPHYSSPTMDIHRENFDSLRLKSPEKAYNPNHEVSDLPAGSRPIKHSLVNAKDQSASASALWGREHGDSNSEKAADSTYRSSFPGYNIDNMDRQDKNRYRQNFSSLNERASWARMESEGSAHDRSRPSSERSRESTPDRRPSMELVMQFKELYNTEWKDAYDETCAVFGGQEKTARHLLWIVTDHVVGYRGRDIGDALPKSKTLLIQYRKQTAPLSVPYVRETCRDKISRTLMESVNFPKTYLNDASRLVAYMYKCAELTWMLCVQEPPIILEYITKETEGARFNKEHYVEYNRPGSLYDYGVWPLLRHGKNGSILWKGVAAAI